MNQHTTQSPRPSAFQGDLQNLPPAFAQMRAERRWVCWRWKEKRDSRGELKWTKVPYQPANPLLHARSNDSSTWGKYEQAVAAFVAGHCDGIGFALLDSHLGAFDLDNCRDPVTGAIAPEAQAIVDRTGSYTEITVSGTGLRVIGIARAGKIHRKLKIPGSPVSVEIYKNADRYIVVTGNPLPGTDPEMMNISASLEAVERELDQANKAAAAMGNVNTHGKENEPSLDLDGIHARPERPKLSDNVDFTLTRMTLPDELQKLIFNGPGPDDDHSGIFHHAVCWLGDLGWSATRIEVFIAGNPVVPPRYVRERRVRQEIERCLGKAKPKQDPGSGAGNELKADGADSGQSNSQSIKLTFFAEIGETARKQWILKGVIAKGETSSWIGPPGTGKSALLTDIAIHVASATDWRKYRAKERCGVVYFALERADLVKRRLQAHARRDKITDLPIAIAGQVIDLMNPECVPAIVSAVRAAEAKFGLGVGMIIIDTFAKGIAANGGDEDKAKDQNITLANLRRIQEQTGVHVAIIGHTGKDEKRGARGSNAHVGDTDLMVQLKGKDIKTAEIIKANDQQEGELTRFKLESFELDRDEDGDPITTAILASEALDESAAKSKDKNRAPLTTNERRALEMLERAVIDAGRPAPASEQFPLGHQSRAARAVAGLLQQGRFDRRRLRRRVSEGVLSRPHRARGQAPRWHLGRLRMAHPLAPTAGGAGQSGTSPKCPAHFGPIQAAQTEHRQKRRQNTPNLRNGTGQAGQSGTLVPVCPGLHQPGQSGTHPYRGVPCPGGCPVSGLAVGLI
jgi:hypothetical protein